MVHDRKTLGTATSNKCIVTLSNGVTVVKAKDRHILGAWFLDWSIMLVVSLATFIALIDNDPATALATAAAVWPVGSLVYGFATCYRRSFGQAVAGTRTVRLDNGQVPGFWRSGWVMIVRLVLYPFIVGVLLLSVLTGSHTEGDAKDRHISINVRETEALKSQGD